MLEAGLMSLSLTTIFGRTTHFILRRYSIVYSNDIYNGFQ